ncbi:hypothetical protein, partial [Morganella morganii]|uniref:hypothetical protein n=1 Tax=Morganella morganii TaxID=582 RepID=UPI0032DAC25E
MVLSLRVSTWKNYFQAQKKKKKKKDKKVSTEEHIFAWNFLSFCKFLDFKNSLIGFKKKKKT